MQLPEIGFLRESQILPQREITEEEARRNIEAWRTAAIRNAGIRAR